MDQQDTHRYKALDGGRGVGILGVCAGHFLAYTLSRHALVAEGSGLMKALWLGLGSMWMGIDFFFVVSGLLITRILLDSRNSPAGTYFKNFYARRVLRIFPLYYGMLAVVFLVLPRYVPFDTPPLQSLQQNQVYLWCYMQNLVNLGGWNTGLVRLGHCWSLAVEEHFYLTWPLLVFFFNRQGLMRITTGLILACPCIRWYLTTIGHGDVVYVNTMCRIDAIAYGCLLALILENPVWKARFLAAARPLLCFGLAGLATCLLLAGPVWFRVRGLDPFGLAALDLTSAAYGLLLLTGELPLHARLLETRWLCFVGKNTYGIYLLHNVAIRELDRLVPLVWFMRYTGSLFLAVLAHVLAELLLAVTVAAIIREVYEKQFLRLNRYFPRRPIVLATGPAP